MLTENSSFHIPRWGWLLSGLILFSIILALVAIPVFQAWRIIAEYNRMGFQIKARTPNALQWLPFESDGLVIDGPMPHSPAAAIRNSNGRIIGIESVGGKRSTNDDLHRLAALDLREISISNTDITDS